MRFSGPAERTNLVLTEASLVGTTLAKPEWPLEILRTIHSFDPCMACAMRMVDADGKDLGEVARA